MENTSKTLTKIQIQLTNTHLHAHTHTNNMEEVLDLFLLPLLQKRKGEKKEVECWWMERRQGEKDN